MTGRVEQHQIIDGVTAAARPPHFVMTMPPGVWRDHVVAVWTAPLLACPEQAHAPLSAQGRGHLAVQAVFEVRLPVGVVGIRPARDLDMARDRETVSRKEAHKIIADVLWTELFGDE